MKIFLQINKKLIARNKEKHQWKVRSVGDSKISAHQQFNICTKVLSSAISVTSNRQQINIINQLSREIQISYTLQQQNFCIHLHTCSLQSILQIWKHKFACSDSSQTLKATTFQLAYIAPFDEKLCEHETRGKQAQTFKNYAYPVI